MMQPWDCNRCTYRHRAIAARCVMCNELRVNREQMRDFITGKTTIDQPQSSSSQQPLISIENINNNHISNNNVATNFSNENEIEKTTATIATTTSKGKLNTTCIVSNTRSSLSTTHNPYNTKRPKLSSGSDPIVDIQSNAVVPPPSTYQTSNATNDSPENPKPLNNNTTVTSQQQSNQKKTVPTKRTRSLSVGGSIISTKKKVKKRPQSLINVVKLPYQPGPIPFAEEHIDTWIYPVVSAYPKRQYQYDIAYTAIIQNTLVSLPTGLGKTLIAAVVLYNYYRWFPTGKVLFLAPTLPLVDQQVQACYEIMGIPATDTALLTGKVPATQRATIWQEKRVFFCTPQTVQKDLESNRCDALKVVCVVLDEAHKSTGEYAYCKVISYLEKAGAKFRVLGLSATPGTSIKAVQNVINVLRINCIEARSDNDPDVKRYIHDRQTEIVVVQGMDATKDVEQKLDAIIGPILDILRKRNVILPQFTDHKSISSYTLLKTQAYIKTQPQNERDNAAIGYLAAGICLLQIRTDLYKHGIGSVRTKLHKLKHEQQRGILASVVKGEHFQSLWDEVETVSCNPNASNNTIEDKYKNNPKLKKLCEILMDHFKRSKVESISSRVIVFSQFRTSVSEIVDILNESKPLIRARHFIGQGKSGSSNTVKNKNMNIVEPQLQQLMDGMKQDEQKDVIARFKDGVYNTLVCTSIGEEGCTFFSSSFLLQYDRRSLTLPFFFFDDCSGHWRS
jgi:ERCC4-related helicase